MPVWHVSVAWQTNQGPLPIERMRRKMRKEAVRLAKSLLGGVGGKPIVFVTDPIGDAIHVQKPLTAEKCVRKALEMFPELASVEWLGELAQEA